MDTFELVIRVLQGLLTPMIALIVAYIAWQQWRVNSNRFRLDLFERRLKVYDAIRALMTQYHKKGNIGIDDFVTLATNTEHAVFVFSMSAQESIQKVLASSREAAIMRDRLYPADGEQGLPRGEERTRVVHEERELHRRILAEVESLLDTLRGEMRIAA